MDECRACNRTICAAFCVAACGRFQSKKLTRLQAADERVVGVIERSDLDSIFAEAGYEDEEEDGEERDEDRKLMVDEFGRCHVGWWRLGA